ncbi:MAG: DUF1952 domain-containing protein [Anaerolineales bacterium]|nr:DUF1952 domain-containing protein [Anaerolineales bacterium]
MVVDVPLIVHDIRDIPLWLLREDLLEMGGTATVEDEITGKGWRVRPTPLEPFRLGLLEVGQVRLEIEVDDNREAEFRERFAKKTFRARG